MSKVLDLLLPAHGQCRLVYVSSTQLKLQPFNGRALNIGGLPELIPSVGVTVSNSGLSANTVYYVYAYMNAGTMTLELSATGHSTHTNGVEVKTGDTTRTLVGMCRTNGGSQFLEDSTNLFVISYFNRRRKTGRAMFTANRTQNYSVSYSEIHTEIRVNFLTWGDDSVLQSADGSWAVSTSGALATAYVSIDGDSAGQRQACVTGLTAQSALCSRDERVVAEGYHYGTLLGSCYYNTGHSVTYLGGQNGQVGHLLSVMG